MRRGTACLAHFGSPTTKPARATTRRAVKAVDAVADEIYRRVTERRPCEPAVNGKANREIRYGQRGAHRADKKPSPRGVRQVSHASIIQNRPSSVPISPPSAPKGATISRLSPLNFPTPQGNCASYATLKTTGNASNLRRGFSRSLSTITTAGV